MLSKIFQHKTQKHQKDKFIPFANQRNFMGGLIKNNQKCSINKSEKQKINNFALIENLKKTTKEYFFQKKFNKMEQKLKQNIKSLTKDHYDYDYQNDINQCLRTIEQAKYCKRKIQKKNKTYVQLMEELNEEISSYRTHFINKLKKKVRRNHKKNPTQQLQEQFDSKLMKNTVNFLVNGIVNTQPDETKKINRQMFKSHGKNAEFMVNFSNQARKYKHMVDNKKLNPWKKWYVTQSIQIFPGKNIFIKKLQKTIY